MSKWATQTLGDGDGEELAEAVREADRLVQIARDEEYARRVGGHDTDWIPAGVDRSEWRAAHAPDPATQIHRSVIGAAETIWLAGYSKPIAGKRMISGVASTSAVNRHGYALLARGCQLRVPIPLLFGHADGGGSIGQVVYLRRTPTLIRFRATIHDNEVGRHAWRLIVDGELSGVSCAADQTSWHLQGEVDGVQYFDSWSPKEISVVRQPACPGCHFRIWSVG